VEAWCVPIGYIRVKSEPVIGAGLGSSAGICSQWVSA
jgi:hypothetical protein